MIQEKNIPYQPFVDQTHIQRTRPRRKTVVFKTSLPVFNKKMVNIRAWKKSWKDMELQKVKGVRTL